MDQMVVTILKEEDILRLIKQAFSESLNDILKHQQEESQGLMSRKEAAGYLRITLPTLASYTKSGIIKGRRIGRRVLFIKSDLDSALKAIKTR